MSKVLVAGVGMVPFATPSRSEPYDVMAGGAVRAALADAGIGTTNRCSRRTPATCTATRPAARRRCTTVGMTGIPVVNVNNNCSTGSTALWLARQAVAGGAADCVLALGFEQMQRGALTAKWTDRPGPFDDFLTVPEQAQGATGAPLAPQLFGGAGAAYAERYGTRPETFARSRSRPAGTPRNNPYAVFRDPVTVEEVLASPTHLRPADAAAVLPADLWRGRRDRTQRGVRPPARAAHRRRDHPRPGDDHRHPGSFDAATCARLVGYDMAKRGGAQQVYEAAGVSPEDIRVVELHDCFTANELLSYEALGLTPEGTAEKFVLDGDNTYGGRVVTNPVRWPAVQGTSARARPASRSAPSWPGSCAATPAPARSTACSLALQHNIGLGGAAVVTLYERVG